MDSNQIIEDLQLIRLRKKHYIWKPFMSKYNCARICEIGVCRGENFREMIKHNPQAAVAVDSWIDDGNVSRNDGGYPREELNKQYDDFKKGMSDKPFVKIYREYSFEAVKHFEDNYFDLVYIDADHSHEGCLRDINDWYPKVKKGRFLLGDDYRVSEYRVRFGVIEAVNEFAKKNNLEFFELPNFGWGMIKKMSDATIIYYSSNREKPDFEARVRENLLKVCGDLPIISVSHKPINLGHNICVGDVGVSGFNMFRQVQIGLEAATTPFVISAEADCLYPPDYFQFRPPRMDIAYRDSNLYVMPDQRDFFFYKGEGATHAQIVGREFYLQTLKKLFEGAPEWSAEEKNFPKERRGKSDIFDEIAYWKSENPVFQIKTHRGMRYYTHSDRTPVPEIPYWGSGKAARAYFLHGVRQEKLNETD